MEKSMEFEIETPKKASFLGSVASGITGWAKGLLAGGSVGAIAGTAVAAVVDLFTTGGVTIASALAGMGLGAVTLGTIGSTAGMMTGVVRSREAAQPSAEDVLNVAKISFTQGIAVGHEIGQAQQIEVADTKWRKKIDQERGIIRDIPVQPARS